MRSENSTLFGGMSATLLWENPNPSARFGSVNVTLSSNFNLYDWLLITYYHDHDTKPRILMERMIKIGESQVVDGRIGGFIGFMYKNGDFLNRRIGLKYTELNKMLISYCNNVQGMQYDNGVIPYQIYGIKGSIQGIK